jgi:Outer membrane protein beta-barrel domain
MSETVLDMGTVRGRIGYAPGDWLLYATGGFAWTYDQLTVTQANSTTDKPFLWRFGWVAGAGVELPLTRTWTAGLEYLYTHYGNSTVGFANAGQTFLPDLAVQELRVTLIYRLGAADEARKGAASSFPLADDSFNVHAQTTFAWLAYPAFRSPYTGPQSLPGGGQGAETFDATLLPASGCGKAPNYGSIRNSTKASALTTHMVWPGLCVARLSSLGLPTPMPAFSACSCARPLISGATSARWMLSTINSPTQSLQTAWC